MKLTDEQKEFIKNNFNNIPDLIELTRRVFDDDSLDGRTKEGRVVRDFLAKHKINYKTTQKRKKERI